jgi:outer membrane lipopolysaccharide assembly protein LptE/RlpB
MKKLLPIVCVVLLMGCGYQMVGKETHIPPGLNSIAIPTFKNLTFEPGVEVQFTQGFLREFILDRRVKVVDRAEADSILEGTVISYNIYAVAFDRGGFVSEYQINMLVRVTLKKRTGEVIWDETLYETLWFRASSVILVNEANKTAALQRIGRLIAERIRSRFFYNF